MGDSHGEGRYLDIESPCIILLTRTLRGDRYLRCIKGVMVSNLLSPSIGRPVLLVAGILVPNKSELAFAVQALCTHYSLG